VQLFTAAGVAVDAEKTVGEDAALEESAELALDESRQGTVAHAGQEALQFHLDDAIENGLLRAMALVCGGDRIVAGRRGGEALHAPRVVRGECPYVEGVRRSSSATRRDDAISEARWVAGPGRSGVRRATGIPSVSQIVTPRTITASMRTPGRRAWGGGRRALGAQLKWSVSSPSPIEWSTTTGRLRTCMRGRAGPSRASSIPIPARDRSFLEEAISGPAAPEGGDERGPRQEPADVRQDRDAAGREGADVQDLEQEPEAEQDNRREREAAAVERAAG